MKQPKPRQILDEVRELLVAQFEPPPQAPPETRPAPSPHASPQGANALNAPMLTMRVLPLSSSAIFRYLPLSSAIFRYLPLCPTIRFISSR